MLTTKWTTNCKLKMNEIEEEMTVLQNDRVRTEGIEVGRRTEFGIASMDERLV